MNLSSLSDKTVKLSKKLGADESEVYTNLNNGTNIIFTNKIESMNSFSTTGIGIRVITDKKIGLYSTSSMEKNDVEEAMKAALEIAKMSKKNQEWVSLPIKTSKVSVKGIFDKKIETMEPEELVNAVVLLIEGVSDYDKRLTLNRSSITIGTNETAICNTYGESLNRKSTFASASIDVKAEDAGKKGLSNESRLVRNWREIDFETLYSSASERALKSMDAKPVSSKKMPVVWRNTVFAGLLGVMFSGTLSADSIQNKRSPWTGRLGENIASSCINLIDDGVREAGVGTREFDDEGVPQQTTPLIDNGVLINFLYDNYTANKDKTSSTGNAHRIYTEFPLPYPNNLILKPSNSKPQELIEDTKYGIYVAETIGEWLSNPISGDLSATVTNGFLIEEGELTQPIKDVIVSGDFFHIIRNNIDLIANDVMNSGQIYAPSVKVNMMNVTENR